MVKKTLVLIHHVDYEYEVVVGSFTSKRDLYLNWKKYLDEYNRVEKRETTKLLKELLGIENRTKWDNDEIIRAREKLRLIEEESYLCYDKAKTLFSVYLVPKNTIRFDREPLTLNELFPDEPLCPWCLSLEYKSSTWPSFDMTHYKVKKDKINPDDPLRCSRSEQGDQENNDKLHLSRVQRFGVWAVDWIVWLLGLPQLH